MPIVIKEIQVKTIVQKKRQDHAITDEQVFHIKKEVMREVKDFLHREHIRKHEQ